MFEKEAEEYAKVKEIERNNLECVIVVNYEVSRAFKDGAEFGYNKANEWHKPSEKLPEEYSLVLAYSLNDTEPSLWKFVANNQWEWLPERVVFCSNDQIRLWKEIVLPELPKEIE